MRHRNLQRFRERFDTVVNPPTATVFGKARPRSPFGYNGRHASA
jgi:hypothetical protein